MQFLDTFTLFLERKRFLKWRENRILRKCKLQLKAEQLFLKIGMFDEESVGRKIE